MAPPSIRPEGGPGLGGFALKAGSWGFLNVSRFSWQLRNLVWRTFRSITPIEHPGRAHFEEGIEIKVIDESWPQVG